MTNYINHYLLLSLLVLLSSSSFSINDYLIQKLQQHDFTQQQLDYALTHSIPLAYQLKRQQFKQGTASWLHYSIKSAKYRAKVALELAAFFNTDNVKVVFWTKHAILLGSENAKVQLANYYYRQHDLANAQQIIKRLTKQSIESAPISAKIAIAEGEIDKLVLTLPLLAKSLQGQKLLKKIVHFNIVDEGMINASKVNVTNTNETSLSQQTATYMLPIKSQYQPTCANSIQFFATNINDLLYSEQLIKQFKQQNPQISLQQAVCFTPVRYRPIKQLHCEKLQPNKRIECDEGQWENIANNIKTKYLAVLLPQGGANVHLGILYLDRHDSLGVFTHEMSHLLGFVDEYPLPANHQNCQQQQQHIFANNIAVLARIYKGNKAEVRQQVLSQLAWGDFINDTTPILQRIEKRHDTKNTKKIAQWQLGTPITYSQEVGLFLSESCDKTPLQAFKPLNKQTQLRYFEKPLPTLYQQILSSQGNNYNMPSFHYNISLALLDKNQTINVQTWLEKAASFEPLVSKQAKILTASY